MKKWLLIAGVLLAGACSQAQVKQYGIKVVKEYPHRTDAYTQGLFFQDGILWETTGQYGESTIRTVDLASGEPTQLKKLNAKYFGEGSVILDGVLYVLTWTNKVAFKYDAATLTYQKTLSYPREGWGITTDGKQLIASDGSANLFFLDKDLKLLKRLPVTMNGRSLRYLNELEWIDGKIWANVYTTDTIVIINPADGKVEAAIDCSGLLPRKLRKKDTDVLNGIALDAEGRIYLTGKKWPRLYQVELVKK
ncbi:MAG: glutaminyl-peptide cyclotransferase [Candidatus Cryptobacteroides sp.]|jgi:glutamine cyclotransferase|nr:glutaminyl-peptide cyclotransferase [Candidatus Cryptobacteroides sp.]